MAPKKICLRAAMTRQEGKSVWTGEYVCSICGQRFRPDPADPVRLSADFAAHKDLHAAAFEK